jgi:hypothetical protein
VIFLTIGNNKVADVGVSEEDLETIAGMEGASCTVRYTRVFRLDVEDSSCKSSSETDFHGYPVCFWIIDDKVVIFEDHIKQAEFPRKYVRKITVRPRISFL